MVDPLAVQIANAQGDIKVLERGQERTDTRLALHDNKLEELQRTFTDLRVELAGVSTRVALITGGTMGGIIGGVIGAIKFFGG